MLAILLDLGSAFTIARYVRKLWAQVLLAIAAGIFSPVVANLLLHLVMPEAVPPGEAMIRILGGVIWHPLIALIALYFFRKRIGRTAASAKSAP
jgi:hypothetical protein